ncbi:MAG: FKBP-type peptidyl-prolyl cis-trans isomerase, partial [Bacteroidota bacterium]|nr:FKBP-type peptidyl-prolyl cis-trans isomerase [Bacteroidota bacterium]
MNVSKDKVISLTYELRAENNTGKVIEIVKEDNPLNFIFGAGYLLPKFESNLDGLKKGDSFEFTLKSADAYGEYDETAIIEVPKNVFMVDGKIE